MSVFVLKQEVKRYAMALEEAARGDEWEKERELDVLHSIKDAEEKKIHEKSPLSCYRRVGVREDSLLFPIRTVRDWFFRNRDASSLRKLIYGNVTQLVGEDAKLRFQREDDTPPDERPAILLRVPQ